MRVNYFSSTGKGKISRIRHIKSIIRELYLLGLPWAWVKCQFGAWLYGSKGRTRNRNGTVGGGSTQQVVRMLCLACYARKLIHIYLTVLRVELLGECGRDEGRTVQSRVHLSFDCFNLNLNLITVKLRYQRLTRGLRVRFGIGLSRNKAYAKQSALHSY